ncbi:SMC5-SMC6 complex localization factor protein 1 [Boothiomyces sp. JEL0838]|nr:SMC5-SMC6 complex localization factor protein 1 [Boothiomyces sp. JEL0838]
MVCISFLLASFVLSYCKESVYCIYGAAQESSLTITVHSSAKGWSAVGNGKGMLNADLFVAFRNDSGGYVVVQSLANAYGLPMQTPNPVAKIVDLAIPAPSWASMAYSFSVPRDKFSNNYFSFACSDHNPQGDYKMIKKHEFAEAADQSITNHSSYLTHNNQTVTGSTLASTVVTTSTLNEIPQTIVAPTKTTPVATNTSTDEAYAAYPTFSSTSINWQFATTTLAQYPKAATANPVPTVTITAVTVVGSSSQLNYATLASVRPSDAESIIATSSEDPSPTKSDIPIAHDSAIYPLPTSTAAKRLGIPILSPNWLIDNEDCSLVDLLGRTEGYEIKELSGFVISTTGFQSSELKEIVPIIKQKGGQYSPNLSSSTTHLITKSLTHDSEKLKAAKKWNITIKEKDWILAKPELYLENHYFYFGEGFETSLSKYLKTIIREGGGNFMNQFGSIVTHFIISGSEPTLQDKELMRDAFPVIVNYKWLSECFITKTLLDYQKWLPQGPTPSGKIILEKKPKVFAGMQFRVTGFHESEKLLIQKGIIDQGGQISDDGIIISPFASKNTLDSKTEFWIEKCIQEEKLITDNSVLYNPTQYDLPIMEFKDYKFGISGFQEIERLWIKRIINLMGAENKHTFDMDGNPLAKVKNGSKGFAIERNVKRNTLHPDGSLKLKYSADLPNLSQTKKILKAPESNPTNSQCSPPSEGDCPQINFGSFALDPDTNESVDLNALNETLENLQNIVPESKSIKRRYNEVSDDTSIHSNVGKISYLTNNSSPKDRLFESNTLKKPKTAKCLFLFSGVSSSVKAALAQKIAVFGGELLNSSTWDSRCTHLIVESPMHTEKFLSACASGAWILSPQFIVDCASKNALVDEEDYQLEGESGKIARFWKKQFITTGKKIFQGWNVLIKLNNERKANYKRLLEAGGAICFDELSQIKKKVITANLEYQAIGLG